MPDVGESPAGVDPGLETAVFISLFTDRRAGEDDELPDPNYRGGWWADTLNDDGYEIGSRLYLLRRSKNVAETLRRARFYAVEALEWLKTDGQVLEVSASASSAGESLLLEVELVLPAGQETRTFAFAYHPESGLARAA